MASEWRASGERVAVERNGAYGCGHDRRRSEWRRGRPLRRHEESWLHTLARGARRISGHFFDAEVGEDGPLAS